LTAPVFLTSKETYVIPPLTAGFDNEEGEATRLGFNITIFKETTNKMDGVP
jgi:hypothetical protein